MGAWIETVIKEKPCETLVIESHPYMGAWIETAKVAEECVSQGKSHPYMGAWIETQFKLFTIPPRRRRTLTWVRGLKHYIQCSHTALPRRTLTWVRGLKHHHI